MPSWTDWSSWIFKVVSELPSTVGTKVATELIAIPIAAFALSVLWLAWKRLKKFLPGDARRRLRRVRTAIAKPEGLWTTRPVCQPTNYERDVLASMPILTIASLKGGVGKTTIAANLAAHFAYSAYIKPDGLRVLVIDLDFQGSLTSMVGLPADKRRPGPNEPSQSSKLISGADSTSVVLHAWPHTDTQNLRAIPAYYDLAQVENRLMIEWLIEDQPFDMPYKLAQALHHEQTLKEYDLIVIDAPSRLTTASIQALCASTHLLIPTIMDGLSSEAVVTFVDQIEELKRHNVCPHIRYAGIVGSVVGQGGDPKAVRRVLEDSLEELDHDVPLIDQDLWVKDKAAFAKVAGTSIAYIRAADTKDRREAREIFDALGPAIWSNIEKRG